MNDDDGTTRIGSKNAASLAQAAIAALGGAAQALAATQRAESLCLPPFVSL